MAPQTTLRILAAAALIAMGSCTTTPDKNPGMMMPDGAANHPIMVEPSYRALKLDWAPAAGGLSQQDQVAFGAFVSDYLAHGNGSIAISTPAVMGGQDVAGWFAARINAMGVPKDKILVASHDAAQGDLRVEVNYVSYQARTDKCGDWSEDLAFTLMNDTPKNFGCSVQQNIAAMVADPRDLLGPRQMGDSDGARRTAVIGNYEQGKITQADKNKGDKNNEQSGFASSTGE
jgi:pilus assembly protein CpaD